MQDFPIFFDGHHDLLSKMTAGAWTVTSVSSGHTQGHIDMPRARVGGYGGGFFAVFIEDGDDDLGDVLQAMQNPPYHLSKPNEIPHTHALPLAMQQISAMYDLQQAGLVHICTDTQAIQTLLREGNALAGILHLEGAEAICEDLHNLETLYDLGLRSIGLTWSRDNRFGFGAPFACPATPDHDAGLTHAGKELVRMCNRMGIMLDVSHLNQQGFYDLAALSQAPIVATHSNAHAISPHARNLTDRQLDAVRDSDGLVGINFATAMLRPDGKMQHETPIQTILDQLEYLLEKLGENRVAFGTDFDGATIPHAIGDCAGIKTLSLLLDNAGYSRELIQKLYHENWLRVLSLTWQH